MIRPRLALLSILTLLAAACGDDAEPRVDGDFCHGVDDGVACDDGDPCTVDDRCGLGVCLGQPALDCSDLDDGACVVGACDPETVTCVAVPKIEGASCDDGDLCTGEDSCQAGVCVGAATDCSALGGPCKAAACDPETGACAVEVFDDNTSCDDGDLCTQGGVCAAGECEETPVDCSDLDTPCQLGACDGATGACVAEVFDDGSVCEDGNPCTEGETCEEGRCGGATQLPDGAACAYEDQCMLPGVCHSGVCSGGVKPCPEPAECQAAVCDPETGECGVEDLPDGSPCNDRDACTVGETCTAGVCGDGVNQCFCRDKDDGTPCDDGQRCTANDACDGGACLGTPISCSQLGDGACLAGACDPTSGECMALPVPDGTSCDDGLACTSSDRCAQGACVGEEPDCSALDDACNVGACDEIAGGCAAAPRADGIPCSDADSCTGGDVCAAGICAGALDVCGACEGKAAGEACDDGDPCSADTFCVVGGGGAMRCEGAPKDCSGLDSACLVGVCDGGTGGCKAVPRPDGGACDDGDACTQDDTCAAGSCQGTALLLCGAQVAACEPAAANDTPAQATPVPAFTDATAVVGWIAPASETDWWELPLPAGRIVTVETKAHCGQELDTVLGIYDATGALLAQDDDGGANAFAKVADLLIEDGGPLFVGVSAYAESGSASYLLAVTTELPPPCVDDSDCACGELTCVASGPQAGSCVPRMPAEVEPNHAPAAASPLPLGGEVRGSLGAVTENDWFSVALTAGTPVRFGTRGYCADGLQTAIAVYAADGVTQLGYASGGGVAGHALLEGFTPAADGTYLLRVQSAAATTGPYVLTASAMTCESDADCACGDQICSDPGAGAPGLCAPAVDAPGGDEAAPLALDARMHGAIEAAYEVDRYIVSVGAGRYDIATQPFCGAPMDTRIEVYDGAGALLASDDDSGEGFFGAAWGVEVPVATMLEVRVRAHGPAVGEYLVTATFAPED